MALKNIKISNKNYGEFDGIEIHLTEKLYNKLSKEKDRLKNSILTLLKNGRAVRGLKHLISLINQKDDQNKIVLTHKKTIFSKKMFYINYDEYRKYGQKIFFSFYRDTGLNSAHGFLAKNFPNQFEMSEFKLSRKEIARVEKDLPNVIKKLTKKSKNQEQLIKETSNVLEELRKEKKELKRRKMAIKSEIENLQAQSSVYLYSEKLKEFAIRLKKNYHETRGKNSWQKWIYENKWLFGIQYQNPIQKERVGFDNIPDFLFPTLDGFIDILEIKRPVYDVIIKDKSHPGSFF